MPYNSLTEYFLSTAFSQSPDLGVKEELKRSQLSDWANKNQLVKMFKKHAEINES